VAESWTDTSCGLDVLGEIDLRQKNCCKGLASEIRSAGKVVARWTFGKGQAGGGGKKLLVERVEACTRTATGIGTAAGTGHDQGGGGQRKGEFTEAT